MAFHRCPRAVNSSFGDNSGFSAFTLARLSMEKNMYAFFAALGALASFLRRFFFSFGSF
jgi:hypothetical protein